VLETLDDYSAKFGSLDGTPLGDAGARSLQEAGDERNGRGGKIGLDGP